MKIRSQKREGNKVTLEIEESSSRFEESFDKALKEAGKEVRIPGFRPGKAPIEMVEKAVSREAIEHRAAQNLIAEAYPAVIDEAKLEPVDYPGVEIVTQSPFVFKLTVEVYPEVKLGKYKGVKAEKKSAQVSEEDILVLLGRLQERFAVAGPDGKKELLPLDDEFAKKVSRYGTLAELKEEVREAMQRDKTAEAESDLKNQLIAAASAEAKVDIPEAMIGREVDIMLDELRTSLAQGNLTLEDYLRGAKKQESELRGEMKKSAEIRVKGKVVLREIAAAEKMEVTPEEMQEEIKAITGEGAAGKLEEGTRKYVEEYLLRKKALDFLLEKASIREAKV